MAEEKSGGLSMGWLVAAIGAGLIGTVFVGPQTAERLNQTNVSNLPALEARLETVERQLSGLDAVSQSTIEARFGSSNESQESLVSELATLEDTINRRFIEDVATPDNILRADIEKNEDRISELAERISRLEANSAP